MLPKQIYWRAPDFRKTWRRSAWHSLTLFAAFVLGIVAFVKRDIPFFILVIVVEFCILFLTRGNKKKMIVNYALTAEGFFVGDEVVYYKNEVARFAMVEHESQDVNPWFELILVSASLRFARRRILIPHEQGFLLREYLAKEWGLPEFEYSVGTLEFFRRFIGL